MVVFLVEEACKDGTTGDVDLRFDANNPFTYTTNGLLQTNKQTNTTQYKMRAFVFL
jgi:hypothetical protein